MRPANGAMPCGTDLATTLAFVGSSPGPGSPSAPLPWPSALPPSGAEGVPANVRRFASCSLVAEAWASSLGRRTLWPIDGGGREEEASEAPGDEGSRPCDDAEQQHGIHRLLLASSAVLFALCCCFR